MDPARGRLFVAGGETGRIFVYDLRTRALLGRFDTGAGGCCCKIVTVCLSAGLRRGRVVARTTDPRFDFPTTTDAARGRPLVVNAQFDDRMAGRAPDLPFTVEVVPVPVAR